MADDCDDVPMKGQEYAMDVKDQVEDMHAWVEENQHYTDKQVGAYERWAEGISKWLENQDW